MSKSYILTMIKVTTVSSFIGYDLESNFVEAKQSTLLWLTYSPYFFQFSKVQLIKPLMCGIRLRPLSVSEYSTLGGISGNNSRLMRLSSSNTFKFDVSTLGDISGIARPI